MYKLTVKILHSILLTWEVSKIVYSLYLYSFFLILIFTVMSNTGDDDLALIKLNSCKYMVIMSQMEFHVKSFSKLFNNNRNELTMLILVVDDQVI